MLPMASPSGRHHAQQPRETRSPFFLYESFTVPHAGGWAGTAESGAPVPNDANYTKDSWPVVERDHASVITYLDTYIGKLLDKLSEIGIDDETCWSFDMQVSEKRLVTY